MLIYWRIDNENQFPSLKRHKDNQLFVIKQLLKNTLIKKQLHN